MGLPPQTYAGLGHPRADLDRCVTIWFGQHVKPIDRSAMPVGRRVGAKYRQASAIEFEWSGGESHNVRRLGAFGDYLTSITVDLVAFHGRYNDRVALHL